MTTLDSCAHEAKAMEHRNKRVVLWCVECRNVTAKSGRAVMMMHRGRMADPHDTLPRVIRSKCYFCEKTTTKFVDLQEPTP